MGDYGSDDDAVHFPDYGNEEGGQDPSLSVTTLSSPAVDSSGTGTLVAVVLLSCGLLLVAALLGVFLWKKFRRRGKDTVDRPVISLPTLGTQYEISGLLSQDGQWKSVGSLVETDGPADHATADHATTDRATDRPTAYGELVRVSRYIDAGSVASVRETVKLETGGSQNWLYNRNKVKDIPKIVGENQQEIQMEGEMTILDTRLGLSSNYLEREAPIAAADSPPLSRPVSYITRSQEVVQQPGEAGQHAWRPEARGRVEGQRPFSDVIEQEHYVSPQQVRKLGGAKSELTVNRLLPPTPATSTASAKSETHLSRPQFQPPLPPKSRPLLPPKQTINKSREDIEKVNKDILRISMAKGLHAIKDEEQEEEDYDLPAGSYCPDEDYDDPPLCLGTLPEPELPKILFTPRAEYQEDYEGWEDEEEGLTAYNRKWELRGGLSVSSEKIIVDQDYDDPVHSYQQR